MKVLNIVIPMAGKGSRFANAGYTIPKPLIPIHGTPMIKFVSDNIRPKIEHRFIYICQRGHIEKYNLREELQKLSPGCIVLEVPEVTEGAACTVLIAEKYIDSEDQLMIANSDQFVDVDINRYLDCIGDADGLIMTMTAGDNKWSFIRYNEGKYVTEVREKEVISDEATVGIYNWKHGSDFVKYAKQMIEKNVRVNNEFYVAPIYNEMIGDCKKIRFFNIGSLDNGMYGLGVPADLERFLMNPLSKKYFE